MNDKKPAVSIVIGSLSDREHVRPAEEALKNFGIPYEVRVISAHRSPNLAQEYAANAVGRGLSVIIAGAGKAAHLAGVISSMTILPVIGIPMVTSDLGGLDSLLSTVQMPSGVPVATVAIGGAENAAVLAAQILALRDEAIAGKIAEYKEKLADKIEEVTYQE